MPFSSEVPTLLHSGKTNSGSHTLLYPTSAQVQQNKHRQWRCCLAMPCADEVAVVRTAWCAGRVPLQVGKTGKSYRCKVSTVYQTLMHCSYFAAV